MTTIQCSAQLLSANEKTESHRHTSTTLYHVFRGHGASEIGGQRFEWQKGDSFIVPVWNPHRHSNSSSTDDAILFSMSDAPVLRALGLYREETA
ncbi:MAG: cupin domain-containing protein [Deltaproteobacteria bacterium]|nr:cupin domain-containing protein [Deltaproteobacteria bacterium]